MPDLLLELFSEEIPARMQARAAADLERAVNDKLFAAGFRPEGVKAFATPRRLALVATGLPARQADRKEEKKGPRVGAPQAAIDGFLKSAGLASVDKAEIREDKKGAFYVAMVEEKGRDTADVIAGVVPEIIRGFPWPKSMRWGEGDLRWVRPLKRILCVFDHEIVPFEVDGIVSSDATEGHRVMAQGEIRIRNFEKYAGALQRAFVELDPARRAETILEEARTLCRAQGLELIEDRGLLAEVAGLVEWPVVRMGSFDAKFLDVPEEAISATMRANQKYFSVRDPKTGRLANRFVYVANIESKDGGAASRAGYERVLTARLSDAWFLYRQDLKTPLAARIPALDQITFFEGLGSVGDKARRIAALAREIAPLVGADPQLAEEAALLAKADLVTGMVKEFPELQGKIGRYYARHEKLDLQIADAIRDHYRPLGAEDDPPTAPVSVAVALADKIDTLAAFWSIGKKPTGSGDPFALRRAALGFIEICVVNECRIGLAKLASLALKQLASDTFQFEAKQQQAAFEAAMRTPGVDSVTMGSGPSDSTNAKFVDAKSVRIDLLAFFHDRLKVYLRDKGHRHDHIDAVLSRADGSPEDDLVLIVKKLEALEAFLKTDDGANLAAAFKRGANILKAEEKKGGIPPLEKGGLGGDPQAKTGHAVDAALLQLAEEKALFAALSGAEGKTQAAVQREDFTGAMASLSTLRAPLDAFFDKVTVNADDPKLRMNRLALLQRLIAATATVADLSKLEG
jgi:glycyl-tRNA synthetase beta chain